MQPGEKKSTGGSGSARAIERPSLRSESNQSGSRNEARRDDGNEIARRNERARLLRDKNRLRSRKKA
jgi:hypothetical protein